MTQVTIRDVIVGNDRPLTVIAGPCQLESEDHAQMIAGKMKEACAAAGALNDPSDLTIAREALEAIRAGAASAALDGCGLGIACCMRASVAPPGGLGV